MFLNEFGSKDVYEGKLPDIGKNNGLNTTRKEYLIYWLKKLNNSEHIRLFFERIINEFPEKKEKIASLLERDNFGIEQIDGKYIVSGAVIDRRKPVINNAHFQDIQNKILNELNKAEVSITLVMAWFTNDVLYDKLIEKRDAGVEIKMAIYDDGINKHYGVDIDQFKAVRLKHALRGGIMHNKFCVIDNQVVITGSYNWSTAAETLNDENVTVEYDNKQATRYSVEYRRLVADNKEYCGL